MAPCLPDAEAQRLAVLYEHNLLDTTPEEQFDDLVSLAAHVCGTPLAAVILIDEERQWFKSVTGLAAFELYLQETPRAMTFCTHTIQQDGLMIVPDTTQDPRFAANPFVTGDAHIRFYAGVPLLTEEGYALGSLCVMDTVPRTLTLEQAETLCLLARQAASHLRAARRFAAQKRLLKERERLVADKEKLVADKERLAAETLRADERFRVLFDCSSDCHLLFDEGGIIDCNPATVALLRCSDKAEVLSLHPAVLSPEFQPDGRRSEEKSIEMDALARKNGMHCFEWTHRKMDGEVFPVEVTLTRVTLQNRPAMLTVWHDLTERKRAEHSLRESEARLRLALESGRLGSYDMDQLKIQFLEVSDTYKAHFGLPPEADLAPLEVTEMIHPDDRTHMDTVVQSANAEGHGWQAEHRIIWPDGSLHWNRACGLPIFDEAGRPVRLIGVTQDITERKAWEAERESLAEANRLLLESTSEGIFGLDAEGRFTFVNRAATRMLGYQSDEMLGRDGHALIHHSYPDGTPFPIEDCPIYKTMHHTHSGHSEDGVYWRRDGTSFPAAYSAAPVLKDGAVLGAVVTFSDITDRKALEMERERLAERERTIAAQLQAALQPPPACVPGLCLGSFTRSALEESEVGGDFFDVFALAQGLYALVIGDVSGKGLAAAQQLALVRNSLRTVLYLCHEPARAAASLNAIVTAHDLLNGFVTAFIGVFEADTGHVTYASCAHEPALVRRTAGTIEAFGPTGPPLGVAAEASYDAAAFTLSPGDSLLLYTDGISEAGPDRRRLLGTEGLQSLWRGLPVGTDIQADAETLVREVNTYAAGVFRDDVTMLLARRH